MPKKVISFRMDEETIGAMGATARAENMTLAGWLDKVITERIGLSIQPDVVDDEPPGEEIIIQHGAVGHRHTTKKDRIGRWCQDTECPHWPNKSVV